MSSRFKQYSRDATNSFARFLCLASSLGLVIGWTGCASRQPAKLVIKPGGMAESTASSSVGDQSLKLLTYNILGLPSWMTAVDNSRYPRIRRELERLDPDIILLQEAWTAKARRAAPTEGPWSFARARGQHTFFQQNGLVTLSKYPIVGGEFYPFSREAFPDRLVNKGALKVTVQLQDGRVLNVWNVHLQQGGSEAIRRSQVLELIARVHEAEDNQVADLVGGDFNCLPGSALCRELETSLGPSVQQLSGVEPFATWKRLSSMPGDGKTLDYFFIRPRVPLREIEAVQRAAFTAAQNAVRLSDHLGVEAVVKLHPATSLADSARPLVGTDGLPEAEAALTSLGGGQ